MQSLMVSKSQQIGTNDIYLIIYLWIYLIISMIVIFFSFEAIEIAYTQQVDLSKHTVIGEKTEGVYEVIKEGVQLQSFLRKMVEIKHAKMQEENGNTRFISPVFVCLSSKSKKIAEQIFKSICP